MAFKYSDFICFAFICLVLCGCSTGIESTKPVTMSKEDQVVLQAKSEEILIGELKVEKLGEWKKGKSFIVCDNKGSLVYELPIGSSEEMKNEILEFKGTSIRRTPGGTEEVTLLFNNSKGEEVLYHTGRNPKLAFQEIDGSDIPMTVDLDLIERCNSLLDGRKVWILSDIRYDSKGERFKGEKFEPVTITKILPGNGVFQFSVLISDQNNKEDMVYMNLRKRGAESRTFPLLFSLTDPKLRYPNISSEHWDMIKNGRIAIGMTKEECRLSLGYPNEVNAGHDWNSTIDFWQYPNGMFLRFEDGLLKTFRQ